MSVKNEEIAQRIVLIRELAGLNAAQVAEKLGLSRQEYESYEQNQKELPVSILYDICGALDISMTELLLGDQAKLHSYCVVRSGKGLEVEHMDAYKYQDLAYPFAGRKIEPLLVTVEPEKGDEYHLNNHKGQEYHYILQGELSVRINGYTVSLHPGDSLYFDSNQPHGMKALGGRICKLLVIVV